MDSHQVSATTIRIFKLSIDNTNEIFCKLLMLSQFYKILHKVFMVNSGTPYVPELTKDLNFPPFVQ